MKTVLEQLREKVQYCVEWMVEEKCCTEVATRRRCNLYISWYNYLCCLLKSFYLTKHD